MEEINSGRAALYRQAAAKNGVTAEAAGAVGLHHRRPGPLKPGEYFKPAGGGWMKK